MGHASIKTTQRYILLDDKRRRKDLNDDVSVKIL
jgi:hypothetical protein